MKLLLTALLLVTLAGECAAQTARNFRVSSFSSLGSPTENQVRWVPDGTVGDPCTGGGTGAYAYSDGAKWVCTLHAPGGGGGSGVSSVSTNNSVSGLTATVSNPTTTPVVNLSGTPNIAGTNVTSGTIPTARLGSGTANNTTFLRGDQVWIAGIGMVTSVGLTGPAEFSFGSPITGSGNLSFTKANQNANLVFAGPSSGSAAQPGFRALVAADLPFVAEAKFLFSDITTANSSTVMHGLLPKLSGSGSDCLRGDGTWNGCGGGSGGGDFSTNTTTSALNQVVVASGTGGKTGQFATGTGVGIFTAGVLGFKTNPAGAFVGDTDLQSLSNKTLLLPFIASFANATHNHSNAAGGGQLNLTAFSSTTGSGATVGQTSPVLITPNIGVATATSINKMAITAPATSSTLTVDNGKTFRAANSVTIAGPDGSTQTFQGSDTIVGRSTTDDLANKTMVLPIAGGNSGVPATCTVGQRVRDTSVTPNTFYNCISTNVWGQELVSGTVGAVSAANGGSGLASGDAAGTITISGATSGTKTFSTTLSAAPKCVATPTSDLGAVRFWVTRTTTTLTVNTSSSVSASFDYHCVLIP